ncbi:neutral/alkaline non-lysosomal ceramidase N-terminal domain-containing protein [Gimesia algae]|uniref:Neutral/alkaline non-lysosomal ceramidase n=1 Tax=Gimesia algae TaxID=2527971 RepID=A0A517VFA6_9PLAN|nr:neutral/alkaline non-lysosomal ceramidase N-terminal domain-containing protein [Gimesia algae]QDT91647.1 Neutral/alkaline non-lysosomal ceramidase [Gimesia algae]
MMHCFRVLVLLTFALISLDTQAADTLQLTTPESHQVIQRTGVAPGAGYADVLISGMIPEGTLKTAWEYRLVQLPVQTPSSDLWINFTPKITEKRFSYSARIAAGGWYRLEVRCRVQDKTEAVGTVSPIGVGEVFVVAGQSYATNCNDERLKVADSQQRVVAFDPKKQEWVTAHDPQPVYDNSNGGSIWPPLGDALVKEFRVPVAFVNAAVGATSSTQWLPGGKLHAQLIASGTKVGRFRAVLWQQGESDVIAKTPIDQYIKNIQMIRESAERLWGFNPEWLLAKSTHHPTVYNDPAGELQIRTAIEQLIPKRGFSAGPDTDTLQGENRGDIKSRRHFSSIGQKRAAAMWLTAVRNHLESTAARSGIQVGVAEIDITPPVGFPMAGYYHERLAEGTIDPLKAKAVVFREGETVAALVVCDLIGIATDLSKEVRRIAAEKTGIPAQNIVIAATHSHTAPDYMKELYLYLGKESQEQLRKQYIEKLINGPVAAIEQAFENAKPTVLATGSATQKTPVAFNRRFVMRDGSVKTWQSLKNPEVIRAAGPIDTEIALLSMTDPESGRKRGVLSNFALHLDTVGGMKWSADYPFFIERSLRDALGPDVVSIFGTGCCGDINHANPASPVRNNVDYIGTSLGTSITDQLEKLTPLQNTTLTVESQLVKLPLQDASPEEVARSIKILEIAHKGGKVDFFEHVTAYKKMILDQIRHKKPHANTLEHITWGLSRSLAGAGERLPVDVTVMTIGDEVAIVCLPGEVFVELGLAIKQASPFKTTMIIELSNTVETIYIPHRAAYAGGSYEVTNSNLQPGSGEMLVEAALKLLREAATKNKTD